MLAHRLDRAEHLLTTNFMTAWSALYTSNPGTSAVDANWQHKDSLVVGFSSTACDYVCTGNGVADDALVINAAIAYANANGYKKLKLLKLKKIGGDIIQLHYRILK